VVEPPGCENDGRPAAERHVRDVSPNGALPEADRVLLPSLRGLGAARRQVRSRARDKDSAQYCAMPATAAVARTTMEPVAQQAEAVAPRIGALSGR
jgi:hypothetical protein